MAGTLSSTSALEPRQILVRWLVSLTGRSNTDAWPVVLEPCAACATHIGRGTDTSAGDGWVTCTAAEHSS